MAIMQAASLGSPWLAVAANVAATLAGALIVPAMMTAVYNLAKTSPCPLRFHIATEGAWDVGCASGCLFAAAVAVARLPLSIPLLAALLSVGASGLLLWRYYAPGRMAGPGAALAKAP
jgi:hypothetical protein